MATENDDHYWSVDLVGLTAADARAVVDFASQKLNVVAANAIDPSHWLSLHLDRATAKAIATGLAQIAGQNQSAEGLLEDVTEWLEWSSRSRT